MTFNKPIDTRLYYAYNTVINRIMQVVQLRFILRAGNMVVDFSKLELNKLIPIYLQIIRHVKMEILAGNAQDKLRCHLESTINTLVNPNTVQKPISKWRRKDLLSLPWL